MEYLRKKFWLDRTKTFNCGNILRIYDNKDRKNWGLNKEWKEVLKAFLRADSMTTLFI
jgi:hypothetical protein